MTAHSLQDIAPGFVDITVQSQGVFRSALDALARPGSIARLPSVPANPVLPGGSSAAASLLLALLDQDCSLWVSPALAAGHGAAWLRFHTGCTITCDHRTADFVWAASFLELPPLSDLKQGSAEYPDQSATCVVDVVGWQLGAPTDPRAVELRGPGIRDVLCLCVDGLDRHFVQQHHAMQLHAPCGVDIYCCSGDALMGLPRSVRLSVCDAVEAAACM